jgi:hypothetical protein
MGKLLKIDKMHPREMVLSTGFLKQHEIVAHVISS